MAGIGFELKKLFKDKSAFGYAKTYAYTAVVTVGPFLLAVLLLLVLQLLLKEGEVPYAFRMVYQCSIVYALVFSQILSSGFSMIITRFVADQLYAGQEEYILPSLHCMVVVALACGAPVAILFLWSSPLDFLLKALTYVLYLTMIVIWIQAVYLSALKDYRKILLAYAIGVGIAILAGVVVVWQGVYLVEGMLGAACLGVGVIAMILQWQLQRFFPWRAQQVSYRQIMAAWLDYKELFGVNFFYTLGLFLPNFLFWFGRDSQLIAWTYRVAPEYDMATFFALLTVLPAMIMFVVATELSFYDKYIVYFQRIVGKGNFQEISEARKDMLQVLWSELRHLMEFQLCFSLLFLALGSYWLPKVGGSYRVIEIYTILVLAAYCISMMQSVLILLLYFEDRRGALLVTSLFAAGSFIFNLLSVLGDASGNTDGFGVFAAAFAALVYALRRLRYYTDRIDYFVFCTQPVLQGHERGGWLRNWLLRRSVAAALAVFVAGYASPLWAGAAQIEEESQQQHQTLKNDALRLAEIKQLRKELVEVKEELKSAEAMMREAQDQIAQAEKQKGDVLQRQEALRLQMKEAERQWPELKEQLKHAQERLHQLRQEEAALQEQAENARQRGEQAQASVEAIEARALQQGSLDQLKEEELERLAAAADALNERLEGAYAAAETLQAEADALDQSLEAFQARIEAAEARENHWQEQVQKMQDHWQEARDGLQDALKEEQETKNDLAEAHSFLKEATTSKTELQQYEKEVVKQLQGPPPVREGSLEQRYYSWSGNGSSGYQWLKSGTVAYNDKEVEASLRLQHVNAQATVNGAKGYLAGWMDTQLAVTRTKEDKTHIWRYGVDVNLPTGMTRLSSAARQAQVDDDLVETDVFGEGWNWTPRVEWSYKKGEQDLWTLGTSYGFRGSYVRYSSGTADDMASYSPGNEWSRYLRWRHLGEKHRIEWEASNSVYSDATLNGAAWYRSGNAWDVRGSYAKTLTPDYELQVYIRQHWDAAERSYQGEDLGGGQKRRYAGVALEREIKPGRLLRFSLDGMWADGNLLDPKTDLLKSKRQRYSVGIGYEITLAKERRLYWDLRWFRLHQDEAASYHGYQLSCGFFQSM